MHDRRHYCFGRLVCLNKFEGILEIFFDISSLFAFEKLGLAVTKASTSRTLSFLVLLPAAAICFSAAARYLP